MLKRIIFIVLTMTAALACSTPEKKAQKLIEKHMRNNLSFYAGYAPQKTTVDSLFDIPIDNIELVSLGKEGYRMIHITDSLLNFAGNYLSTAKTVMCTDQKKSQEYSRTADRCITEAKKIQKSLDELIGKISTFSSICTGEHSGWKFIHTYTYMEGWEKSTRTTIFVTDKKIKRITDFYDVNDTDHLGGAAFVEFALKKKTKM